MDALVLDQPRNKQNVETLSACTQEIHAVERDRKLLTKLPTPLSVPTQMTHHHHLQISAGHAALQAADTGLNGPVELVSKQL